jgi:hypothetical protein
MSLDFAVLGQNGTPEKTVSLGVDLHHEFVTSAASFGLARILEFEDYYEDAEIEVTELPSLAKQLSTLRTRTNSVELQRFLDDLSGLIGYAISNGRPLHTIAD